MEAFTFDTSGVVKMRPTLAPEPWKPGHWLWTWPDLSPFVQGYIEALFASGIELPDPAEGWGPSCALGFRDLAPVTLSRILKDCEAATRPGQFANTRKAGAYLWELRTGSPGMRAFPPSTPYLADDGLVYLRENA